MLTVQHLTKSFDGNPVLSDFSCTFPDNGIVTIVGPSGYGKTTLLRCIAGLEKPDSGEILGVPERISYCFQEDRLLPWRTALGNLEAVLGRRRREELLCWLDRVGLSEARDKYPSELSGGMRSRVAFARALAFDAPLWTTRPAARWKSFCSAKRKIALSFLSPITPRLRARPWCM